MIINHEKMQRQMLGVQRWMNNKCVGNIVYPTGVGKTFTAILAIKTLEEKAKLSYLILVPSDLLREQWKERLSNEFTKEFLNRCLVCTPQELDAKGVKVEVHVCIVDEVHEFHTDIRINILARISVSWKAFLGLTASDDDKNFFRITMHIPVVDKMTEEEARERGFISEFVEYNLGIVLTTKEKEDYERLSEIIDNLLVGKFRKDLKLAEKCMNGGYDIHGEFWVGIKWAEILAMKHGWNRQLNFNIYENRVLDDNFNPNVLINDAKRLMNAVRKRKNILYHASNKYTTTLEILKQFRNIKTVLFSESTDFADKIGLMLNDINIKTVVYHSSLQTKLMPSPKTGKLIKFAAKRQKEIIIQDIKNGKADVLSTARALDRGFDVEDIRMGVTTSGTQNTTQYKQRGGRVKRKEGTLFGEDVKVLLINLYAVNTNEEKSLKNRQKEAKHDIVWINKVEDIKYIPPANPQLVNRVI